MVLKDGHKFYFGLKPPYRDGTTVAVAHNLFKDEFTPGLWPSIYRGLGAHPATTRTPTRNRA